MKEAHKTIGRREIIKDGLRTVVLSGLAYVGLSIGWRNASSSVKEKICAIDLPCRICSKLPGCQQLRAMDAKREYHDSLNPSLSKNRGPE
jgi:hypothetical protein